MALLHSSLHRLGGFALSAAAALLATSALAGPIATADGNEPDTRIEVTQLKRQGDALMLQFTLINNSSKALDFSFGTFGDPAMSGGDYSTIGGVHLIDLANKKKYLVIRDQRDTCICSRGLDRLQPNEKINLWAKFPAPPADVERLTVVVPHFMPVDDAPISQ